VAFVELRVYGLTETWGRPILIEKNPGAELRAESRAHNPFLTADLELAKYE